MSTELGLEEFTEKSAHYHVPLEIPLSSIRYKITLHIMKVSTKKNDGVSPVIGTILLVAITVVLVAIISAVVMGMTGDLGTNHVVGVKVDQNASTYLLVTVTGGDTNGLSKIYVYNGSTPVDPADGEAFAGVGAPMAFHDANNLKAGKAAISVVGKFADGNQTIYTGTMYLI